MHKKEIGNQQKNIFCCIPAMSSYFPYQVISDKNNRKKKPNKNQRAKQHSTPELSYASLFLFNSLLHSVHPGESSGSACFHSPLHTSRLIFSCFSTPTNPFPVSLYSTYPSISASLRQAMLSFRISPRMRGMFFSLASM